MSDVLHIYTRVSTVAQEEQGTSLSSQKELGIKKANELGFSSRLWNEGGASSAKDTLDNRPVLVDLLTEIDAGRVKHLFVYNTDRLSRNEQTWGLIKTKLLRNDVTLHTSLGVYQLADPMNKLLLGILSEISAYDNQVRTERSRLGKIQQVRNGQWHGGPPPFGYKISEKKLVVDDEEAKWVKRIFSEYANGISIIDIKTLLDQNGVLPRRKGSTWTMGSIQKLIGNTHFIGRYKYHDKKSDQEIEVSCPKILSASVWQKCNDRKKKTLVRKGQINRTTHFYMLRDLMFCGHCGKPMGGRIAKSQNKAYYYCTSKERNWERGANEVEKWKRGRNCEMVRSLNIEETDRLVWGTVKRIVGNSHVLMQKIKEDALKMKDISDKEQKLILQNLQKKERLAVKNLKRVEESIAKIETDRLLEKMDLDLFKQVRKNLDQERNKVVAEVDGLREALSEATTRSRWIDWVSKFREKYKEVDDLSPEQKKEYLAGVLNKIDVYLDHGTNEHTLVLDFKFPIVEDAYSSVDRRVIEGRHAYDLTASFSSKYRNNFVGRSKKKALAA